MIFLVLCMFLPLVFTLIARGNYKKDGDISTFFTLTLFLQAKCMFSHIIQLFIQIETSLNDAYLVLSQGPAT